MGVASRGDGIGGGSTGAVQADRQSQVLATMDSKAIVSPGGSVADVGRPSR